MTAREHDRGLLAVRRVRDARETDSRLGLQQALATQRHRRQQARAAEQRLAAALAFAGGAPTQLHAHAQHVGALAHDRARAAEQAASSTAVAEEAARRWQHDRARLGAVELLLERRAADRAAEAERRESRRLDDLAAQGWLRRRTTATEEGDR